MHIQYFDSHRRSDPINTGCNRNSFVHIRKRPTTDPENFSANFLRPSMYQIFT